MKVLQVCYIYPPSYSGYGKQLHTLNVGLASDSRLDITIITAYDGHKPDNSCKINVRSLFSFTRPGRDNEWKYFYAFCILFPIRFLRHFIAADLVHVVKAGPEAAISVLLGRLLGKTVIVKVAQDEMQYDVNQSQMLRQLRLKLVRKADGIVALSEKIASSLRQIGVDKDKIWHIANAVDITKINSISVDSRDAQRRSLLNGYASNEFIYLFVGSISKRKGVHDLLCAFEQLGAASTVRRLVLIGPNYGDVESLYDICPDILEGRGLVVEYIGQVQNALQYMAIADALVLPSYSEGMPNVVLEALCTGTPVLMSDIPVAHELIDSHNGMIFELGRVDILTQKLDQIFLTEFDREKIKENAWARFALDSIADNYKTLYGLPK